jgi:hypothetical protein
MMQVVRGGAARMDAPFRRVRRGEAWPGVSSWLDDQGWVRAL